MAQVAGADVEKGVRARGRTHKRGVGHRLVDDDDHASESVVETLHIDKTHVIAPGSLAVRLLAHGLP